MKTFESTYNCKAWKTAVAAPNFLAKKRDAWCSAGKKTERYRLLILVRLTEIGLYLRFCWINRKQIVFTIFPIDFVNFLPYSNELEIFFMADIRTYYGDDWGVGGYLDSNHLVGIEFLSRESIPRYHITRWNR